MKTEPNEKKGKPRGKKGGRHSKLINPQRCNTNLEPPTIATHTALGEGNLSEGIRRAAKVIDALPPKVLQSILKGITS